MSDIGNVNLSVVETFWFRADVTFDLLQQLIDVQLFGGKLQLCRIAKDEVARSPAG